jgi:TPR repeat protein
MALYLDEAANRDLRFAVPFADSWEREDFLQHAAEVGHAPAMYQVGLKSGRVDEKRHWFREAAQRGYPPAMYAYGLCCTNPETRRSWLQKAALDGHQGAIRALAGETRSSGDGQAGVA